MAAYKFSGFSATVETAPNKTKASTKADHQPLRHDPKEKLPLIAPWAEKKLIIIAQAKQRLADKKVAAKWNDRCREWADGNISRCPNVEDIKTIEEILPTNWLSKLIPPGRKSKR